MRLLGKVALVTGGSRGIGRAIALRLAGEGASVVVAYHAAAADAQAVVSAIAAAGGRAIVSQADLRDPQQAAELIAAAVRHFGGLHLLVLNAGEALYRLLMDTTPTEWNQQMSIHLGGAYACARSALSHLLSVGQDGRIVAVGSIWGQVGAAGEVAYSTAKAGLHGFVRALAREVARSGVTVNAIAPGAISTGMLECLSDDERDELIREIPMGRLGEPVDVAEAVAFLCSSDAGYITGQILGVNGGWVM